jgi:hypothetical protein
MAVLTPEAATALDHEAAVASVPDVVGFLAGALGVRMTAHLAGLRDVKQISRYRRADGPRPGDAVERRLREGYKVVRTLADAYGPATAKAWLFGTNSRLDDRAPVDVLRHAVDGQDFTDVVRAARQAASFEA